jgi:hypothetical protein
VRPVVEVQRAENNRLLSGVDNSHSCALLLALPTSLSPDCGPSVFDPWTWKETSLYSSALL